MAGERPWRAMTGSQSHNQRPLCVPGWWEAAGERSQQLVPGGARVVERQIGMPGREGGYDLFSGLWKARGKGREGERERGKDEGGLVS